MGGWSVGQAEKHFRGEGRSGTRVGWTQSYVYCLLENVWSTGDG